MKIGGSDIDGDGDGNGFGVGVGDVFHTIWLLGRYAAAARLKANSLVHAFRELLENTMNGDFDWLGAQLVVLQLSEAVGRAWNSGYRPAYLKYEVHIPGNR